MVQPLKKEEWTRNREHYAPGGIRAKRSVDITGKEVGEEPSPATSLRRVEGKTRIGYVKTEKQTIRKSPKPTGNRAKDSIAQKKRHERGRGGKGLLGGEVVGAYQYQNRNLTLGGKEPREMGS